MLLLYGQQKIHVHCNLLVQSKRQQQQRRKQKTTTRVKFYCYSNFKCLFKVITINTTKNRTERKKARKIPTKTIKICLQFVAE